jgi:hypothetical protein
MLGNLPSRNACERDFLRPKVWADGAKDMSIRYPVNSDKAITVYQDCLSCGGVVILTKQCCHSWIIVRERKVKAMVLVILSAILII